jgi:hypothetical protein
MAMSALRFGVNGAGAFADYSGYGGMMSPVHERLSGKRHGHGRTSGQETSAGR